MSAPSEPPVIGICAVRERARWSFWDQEAHLVADAYVACVQRAGYPAGLSSPHQANPGRRRRARSLARRVQSASPLSVRRRVARMPTRSMRCGNPRSLVSLPAYRPVETTRDCGG